MPISKAVTAGMTTAAAAAGMGAKALATAGGDSGRPVGEAAGSHQFSVSVDQEARDREQKGQMAGLATAAIAAAMLPLAPGLIAGMLPGAAAKGAGAAAGLAGAAAATGPGATGYAVDRPRIPVPSTGAYPIAPGPVAAAGSATATPPAGMLPAPSPRSLFKPEPLLLPAPQIPAAPVAAETPPASPQWHPDLGPMTSPQTPRSPLEHAGGPGPSSEDVVRVENRDINPRGKKL